MTGDEGKTPVTMDAPGAQGAAFPPVPGEDGKVVMLFRSQGESGPKLRGDGTADFREVEAVVQVKAGTPLARLQPPGLGSPGRDAHGNSLPAAPGKPAQLIPGPGTKVSPDGQNLLAECDGAVAVRNGAISVSALLELGKGVDFHTGNIRFDGEVRVKGNVAEGFRIEAGGNIRVEGDAEGAVLISARGNVQVTGGFFGQSKGSIQAKGEVKISSARQAEIRCGSLVVEKSMQDCQVTAHGISASKADCRIFGGKLMCFGSARLAHVGADGSRTELVFRDEEEEALRAEKASLEALEAKEKDLAGELDRKLRTFKAWITKAGNAVIPPKTAAEMKAAAEAFTQCRRKLTNFSSERAMVDGQLAGLGDRKQTFSAAGSIEGNVHLDLLHFRRLLDSHDGGKEFLISKEKGLLDRTAPAVVG
ncbi:MAG: DUF342 domain-containing protein [Fibrobacteres bacterium]|jgi:uncharacterized protein (DUF342 family)|nr:DUF342 domain-containing protein [Fibrobacterota bacterium]